MKLQQAQRLFMYADWVMLGIGLCALVLGLCFAVYALFPSNRGRRKSVFLKAIACVATFALVLGIQASVLIAWFGQSWTTLRTVFFFTPFIALLCGLLASIYFGTRVFLKDGRKRGNPVTVRSLMAFFICGICAAPHAVTILIPIIAAEDRSKRPGTLVETGEPIPDFELTTLDGRLFGTIDLRGQVVLINFFATWCAPCNMELHQLQGIWDEFGDNDKFQMIAIGRDEADEVLREFRDSKSFTFAIAADPDATIYRRFASQSVPRTFLVSKDGIVIHEWTGAYEDEIAHLKRLLKKELD